MRSAALIILSFAASGAAQAADARLSDVDYLRASRCKGLAASPAGAGLDASRLDLLLKRESRSRPEFIVQKGEEETARALRQGRDADRRPRLAAELSGACAAFLGGESAAAAQNRSPAS